MFTDWDRAARWGDDHVISLSLLEDWVDIDDSDGWFEYDYESGIELQPGGAAFVDVQIAGGELVEGTLLVRQWGAFNDFHSLGEIPHRVGRIIVHPAGGGGRVCVRDGVVQVFNLNSTNGWERSVELDPACPKATVVWVNTDITRQVGSIVEEGKLEWNCHDERVDVCWNRTL